MPVNCGRLNTSSSGKREKIHRQTKISLSHGNPQVWPRLCVRKASSRGQEEAVSNAIETVLRKVMGAIGEHELDELGYNYSSTFVAESVLRVYTITNIRCELRDKKARRYDL